MDLAELEASFQRYVQDLPHWVPDGVIEVDLELLQRYDLLDFDKIRSSPDQTTTHLFHVAESDGKITLHNDEFVVWIVPEVIENNPITFVMIALRSKDDTHLELAFSTSGIYNTSKLVLRVLEKLLLEVQDTETEIHKITL